MEDDQMFGSFTTGAARMKRDLGDDLFAALSQPGLLLTGGYPLRVACGLPTGDDVDVLSNVDDYSTLRNRLIGMGYKIALGETSTGFRAARGDADLGVYFREKWNAPGRMSVDCLSLITTASHRGDDIPADTVAAARAFVDTYDAHAHRHMVDLHDRVWFATPEVK